MHKSRPVGRLFMQAYFSENSAEQYEIRDDAAVGKGEPDPLFYPSVFT